MAKGDLRKGSAALSDVLKLVLKDMGLEDKVNEARMVEALPEILGPAIFKRIDKAYIHDRKLFIRVKSAVVRNELSYLKEAMLDRLREVGGEDMLVDIIFR